MKTGYLLYVRLFDNLYKKPGWKEKEIFEFKGKNVDLTFWGIEWIPLKSTYGLSTLVDSFFYLSGKCFPPKL